MRRLRHPPSLLLTTMTLAALCACGGSTASSAADADAADGDRDAADSADTTSADTTAADTVAPIVQCSIDLLPATAFSSGPFGVHRGEVAADFTVPLVGGTSWRLADAFTGCDVYVVLVDAITVSPLDPRPVWEDDAGLAALLARSPDNVHYLFVSNAPDAAGHPERVAALRTRLAALVAGLAAPAATHWGERLHVVADRAQELGGWLGAALTGSLRTGLVIDRRQRLHGVGSLGDVTQQDAALSAAGHWPWRNSVAYAAYEAQAMNADHLITWGLGTRESAQVVLFAGEVLSEQAEVEVTLPKDVDRYGSLFVELTLACPDPEAHELDDNCGAWDYLASLTLREDDGAGGTRELELARFITPYHRESHGVVDATALLARLAGGGPRRFHWSFAPSWNPQPTATRLRLVFGDRDAPLRPRQLIPLFSGGPFGANYNATRAPIDLPIPATAKRVELWALTTGHGSGTAQCAEFCNHQHRFEVNGHAHYQTFLDAGSEQGCLGAIARGVVPNQAGTWWFGRGGWCPGAPVVPWIVDVTAEVTPGNEAHITYRGLFAGADPPEGAGDIVLSSYLVVWE